MYLLGNAQNGTVIQRSSDDSAVGHDDDIILLAVLDDVFLLAKRVELLYEIPSEDRFAYGQRKRTSIWFTAGISSPDCLISSRFLTLLHGTIRE